MAFVHATPALCLSHELCPLGSTKTNLSRRFPDSDTTRIHTMFVTVACKTPVKRKSACKATLVSIRCEQSTKEGNGLDVWLGRLAMVGFAAAISVEVGTGKGLLENFGLTTPLPTVALAVTALAGVLTAIFIFQSGSEN